MERMELFFNPRSVALIGATDREPSAGRVILENLLLDKDRRKIYPINPNREKVFDMKCYPNISSVPESLDLAIIITRAEIVPDVVEESGKAGVRAIIIISTGFKEIGAEGKAREDRIADIARKYNIRIMGPNCMGVIRPDTNLNTTFISRIPKAGYVAFLSQSGALGSAALNWAINKNLGFSAFVSLGSMLDVNFGDLIDYLGRDPETKSIIIHIESIGNPKKFISAAKGFARTKPIIILKSGKFPETAKAVVSHIGAMVGEDLYYDAIFRRAGAVRVEEIEDLFNCASILGAAQLPKSPNLAIITNAGGPGVLAADTLLSRGGKLAQLRDETLSALNEVLPPYWSKSNPIDILADADFQRYAKTIELIIKDPGVDGAVVVYTFQGGATPTETAKAVIEYAGKGNKPILTAWLGDGEMDKARQLFYESKVPTYEFPEEAVRTYLYMYQYARNLEMLYETPEELPLDVGVPKNHLKTLIHRAVREGKTFMGEEDSKKFLATYKISSTPPHIAKNAEDAITIASEIGYPVAVKSSSPEIVHKSDVGEVMLNISSAAGVKKAFSEVMENVKKHKPGAEVEGVSVQKMITDYDYEFIIRSRKDPTFGPAIMFGLGGIGPEVFKNIAVGIPPLNQALARRLLEQTQIYEVLSEGFGTKRPANLPLLEDVLVKFSNLIADFLEIREFDVALLSTTNKTVAVGAKITLDTKAVKEGAQEYSHLIITPYPSRYVQSWKCKDGRSVLLRPIRPEDEPLEKELIVNNLSEESMRFRFYHVIREMTHGMLTGFCNVDYDREIAIIAEYTSNGKGRNVGEGRMLIQPGEETGEFAVVVAEDFQGAGLGLKLSDTLIGIAIERGLRSIYASVLNSNEKIIGLVKRLGFTIEKVSPEESKITLDL